MGRMICMLLGLLVASVIAQEENYMGCYKDTYDRALPYNFVRFDKNTPLTCIEHCRCNGHPFSGVQYSKECWCGTTYDKHGGSSACNLACTGDSSQTCGGHFANSVYSTEFKSCPDLNGMYPDPCDMTKYYHCSNGIPNHMSCPDDLCWNDDLKTCDWAENVPGCSA